ADNFLPGDIKIGEAEVINNTGGSKRIATEAINYPKNIAGLIPSNDLSRAMTIIIKEKDGNDIYGGNSGTGEKTLYNFYKNGETYLSDVGGSKDSKIFQFIISFPDDKGDDWRETETNFDIIVGFQGKEGEITPPGTDPGGGSGAGVLPGLIIKYESAYDTGDTWAKIKWWTSYNATSRVIYCKKSENCALNLSDNSGATPLYGFTNTTSEENTPASQNGVLYREMTLIGLKLGTIYEYRCISHASPPTISRIHTFTTLALAKTDETSEPLNNPVEENSQNIYNKNKPVAENKNIPKTQEQDSKKQAENNGQPKGNIIAKSLRKIADSAKDITGAVLGEKKFLNSNTENSKFSDNAENTNKNQDTPDHASKKQHTIAFFIILFIIITVLIYTINKIKNKKEQGDAFKN
ncbi:MAG: hypothetical protein U9O55_00250, partial [Patescibacteria group bacterium]|nr:hypothetical protein [Patescibacteria group bacterium]